MYHLFPFLRRDEKIQGLTFVSSKLGQIKNEGGD